MQKEPFPLAPPPHTRYISGPLLENRNRRLAPQPARAVRPYVGGGGLGPLALRNAAAKHQQNRVPAPPFKPAVRRLATDYVPCAAMERPQTAPAGTRAQANDFKTQFEDLEVIGKGSFGIIRKIRRKSDGHILARKEINYKLMSEKERSQLLKEVKIITDLNHPNILKSYDVYNDSENCILYLVLEYCEGGDLGMLVKKCKNDSITLNEECVWAFLIQILHALCKCHTNKPAVMHRDLKPDNVLLDGLHNVKLADFGLSTMVEDAECAFGRTFVGTPFYMSPELMHESTYNAKSDMWALGCLVYELCALEPPFQAKTHAALAQRIKEGRPPALPLNFSRSLNDIVQSLLQLDHRHRPSAAELLSCNVYIPMEVLSQMVVKRQEYKERASGAQAELVQRQEEFRADQDEWLRKEQAWKGLAEELRRREAECRKAGELLVARRAATQKAEEELARREAELQRRTEEISRRQDEFTRAASAAVQVADTRGRRRPQVLLGRPMSQDETKPNGLGDVARSPTMRLPLVDLSNREGGLPDQTDPAAADPSGSTGIKICLKTDTDQQPEREIKSTDQKDFLVQQLRLKADCGPSKRNLFSPSAPKMGCPKVSPRRTEAHQGFSAFWLKQAVAKRSGQQRNRNLLEREAGAGGWTGSVTIASPTMYARHQQQTALQGGEHGSETSEPPNSDGAAASREKVTRIACYDSTEALDWYETPSPYRRLTISHV